MEEEINSYLDSPSESVYDEFEEMAYAGSCLSHNILGSPESVKKLTGEDCRGFLDRYYTPGNMVVYCSSPLPPERVERLVSRYFSCMSFPDRGIIVSCRRRWSRLTCAATVVTIRRILSWVQGCSVGKIPEDMPSFF